MSAQRVTVFPDGRGCRGVHVPKALLADVGKRIDRAMAMHVGRKLDDGGYIAGQMRISDYRGIVLRGIDVQTVRAPSRDGLGILRRIAVGPGGYRFAHRRDAQTPSIRALVRNSYLVRHPHDDQTVVLTPIGRYVVERSERP